MLTQGRRGTHVHIRWSSLWSNIFYMKTSLYIKPHSGPRYVFSCQELTFSKCQMWGREPMGNRQNVFRELLDAPGTSARKYFLAENQYFRAKYFSSCKMIPYKNWQPAVLSTNFPPNWFVKPLLSKFAPFIYVSFNVPTFDGDISQNPRIITSTYTILFI